MNKLGKITLVLAAIFLLATLSLAASRTYYVQETDFVKLSPTVVDPDNDEVNVTYSEPLDSEGEWQTTFDDAGQYTITISASDGQHTVTEDVLLVVEEKNQAPMQTKTNLHVDEGDVVDLNDVVNDPDEDVLEFDAPAPFNEQGRWQTTFDDAGEYTFDFQFNDGSLTESGRVSVTVVPVNRAPLIESVFSDETTIIVSEDETVEFEARATDLDGDDVEYEWQLQGQTISKEAQGAHYFGFDDEGRYVLTLLVSDEESVTIHNWDIVVKHVNREPELFHSPITVSEGEMVELDLPAKDQDGDILTYSYEAPLVDGRWQTTFDDAGEYTLEVEGFDGEFSTTLEIPLTILDVDREPQLNVPNKIVVNEGERLNWDINVVDPDGDEVHIEVHNAPFGATLEGRTFSWSAPFDAIHRRGGRLSDFLNVIRLEQILIHEKERTITVNACGKELCTSKDVRLLLYNTNRAPQVDEMGTIHVNETQKLSLSPTSTDPDEDIIRYTFSKPLGTRSGEWVPSYDDAGNYTIEVVGSDGQGSDMITVDVIVENVNRIPELSIKDDDITVNENQEFLFRVDASDPDKEDSVEVYMEYVPEGGSFEEGAFSWSAPYDSVQNKTDSWWHNLVSDVAFLNKKFNREETVIWLKFLATDGDLTTAHPVKITIKNVNREPIIVKVSPEEERISAKVGQPIIFEVEATDEDFDALEYEWSFSFLEETIHQTTAVQRTFVTPGVKTVSVKVSDGRDESEWVWVVDVEDVPYVAPAPAPVFHDPWTYKVYVIEY